MRRLLGNRCVTQPGVGAELEYVNGPGWEARSYLNLPGVTEGAPADAVVFETDSRDDLGKLDKPQAVIVRGKLLRRRPRIR